MGAIFCNPVSASFMATNKLSDTCVHILCHYRAKRENSRISWPGAATPRHSAFLGIILHLSSMSVDFKPCTLCGILHLSRVRIHTEFSTRLCILHLTCVRIHSQLRVAAGKFHPSSVGIYSLTHSFRSLTNIQQIIHSYIEPCKAILQCVAARGLRR